MLNGFISSGPQAAEIIFKGSELVDQFFHVMVLSKDKHNHQMTNDIYFEFVQLLGNLCRIESEFCTEKLINGNLFYVLFYLMKECRFGQHITLLGLDAL